MKVLLYISLTFSITNAFSQNCSEYMHFKKGASYEMETYDSKGTRINRVESLVKELNISGGKSEATIHSINYDKSNVRESEGDYTATCLEDKVLIDISNLVKSDKIGGSDNNMDIKVESGFLEIPKVLTIGQSLPNNSIKITMSEKKSGTPFGTSNITIQDKKVEARETITTPAGAYVCYKITYNSKVEATLAASSMSIPPQIYPGVYYISKDVGLVKAVNLDKKGQVKSYTLLSKVKK